MDKPPAIDGRAERSLVTATGFLVVYGWLKDEGHVPLKLDVFASGQVLKLSTSVLLRSRRPDVEELHGTFSYDNGYLFFARFEDAPEVSRFDLSFSSLDRRCHLDVVPDLTSEKRLLEDVLARLGAFQAHGGREVALRRFLSSGGRTLLAALHDAHVRRAAVVQQCVGFGTPRPGPTFQTVLFGSMEAALFQPLLFAAAGIRFGGWCYVCNSPQDTSELLRLAHLTSKLYDIPIKIVILSENAGFGAANNAAVAYAAADVVLINPDVHVMARYASLSNEALQPESFVGVLRGALLFYDDETLMHGGMHLAEDMYAGPRTQEGGHDACSLLRVEHHDKGVPFRAEDWPCPRPIPAITGALMAFQRQAFEAMGGFSTDYLFGHYEDADLCLRWAEAGGRVEVDPRLRLVHLEGQGSKTKRPHFHGASIVNRYVFDDRVRGLSTAQRAIRRDAQPLPA